MPSYAGDELDDREMRQRVLGVLAGIDKKVRKRHVKEFTVVRSYDRKGHRSHCNFVDDPGPYRSDPMTLIRVEIEVPDDVTPELKDLVAEIAMRERVGMIEAKKARLDAARQKLAAAQAEVDAYEKEIETS